MVPQGQTSQVGTVPLYLERQRGSYDVTGIYLSAMNCATIIREAERQLLCHRDRPLG